MNYEQLKQLIDASDAVTWQDSDADIADWLNAPSIDVLRVLGSDELLAWAGQNARFVRVEMAANTTLPDSQDPTFASVAGLVSVAKVANIMLQRDNVQLDLNLPDRAAMLAALVQGGVLTQADSDDLTQLATTQISPARDVGISVVQYWDVARARALGGE